MRKIRLEFETLEVESFVTDASSSVRGTVAGNAEVLPTNLEGCETQEGCDTQDGCGGTDFMECDASIHYSCYHTCQLIDTCAQASACTDCQGGVTWFCY